MKRALVLVVVSWMIAPSVLAQVRRTDRSPAVFKIAAHATSAEQRNYPERVDVKLKGTRFPMPWDGHQLVVGAHKCTPSSCWSATEACGTLGPSIVGGATYPVKLVDKKGRAVSNSVDLFLMHPLNIATSPNGLAPGKVVEVTTMLTLGPKGSKVIRYAGAAVPAVSWQPHSFSFRIPPGTLVPSKYEVFLEDGGREISTRAIVTIRGPRR